MNLSMDNNSPPLSPYEKAPGVYDAISNFRSCAFFQALFIIADLRVLRRLTVDGCLFKV